MALKKGRLFLILCLCPLLFAFGAQKARAAEPVALYSLSDGVEARLFDDGELRFEAASDDTVYEIPDASADSAALWRDPAVIGQITSVAFAERGSVTRIGSNAFRGCVNLVAAALPDTVTDVVDDAFEGAENLCLSVGCASYARTWASGMGFSALVDGKPTAGQRYILVHSPAEIPAVAAACTESGLTAGSRCESCGAVLAPQETVPALGHDWGVPRYTWNDEHSACTATRVCLHDESHTESETLAATADVTCKPGCTEMGETTYAVENFANLAFKDQAVTLTDVPALGHDWDEPRYTWNDEHTRLTAERVCLRDESHVETETVRVVSTTALWPTCIEMGQTRYRSYNFNNPAFAFQIVTLTNLPALGHDWGEPCYTWNDEHSACTATRVCLRDESHTESETLAATADVTCKPGCTEMGETTYAVENFANPAFKDQIVTLADVPALGHDWGEPCYTWNDEHSVCTATRVCLRDESHTESESVEASALLTLVPTCVDAGETSYTSAAFANPAFEVQTLTLPDVPPLGHAWGEPCYTWSEDYSQVTATRVCEHDARHIHSETVGVTSEITLEAGCEEAGQTTYTSGAFSSRAFSVQTLTLNNLPPRGHSWVCEDSIAATKSADGARGGGVCSLCGMQRAPVETVSRLCVLLVPTGLRHIGEEAFAGVAAQQVTLPEGTLSIGKRAFAACSGLLLVEIPASVEAIEEDAFAESDVTVICPDGSYAAAWCDAHRVAHNP